MAYQPNAHCTVYHNCNFFNMSTEFDKNISDCSYDYTDHKNDINFFMRLVKWPKIQGQPLGIDTK